MGELYCLRDQNPDLQGKARDQPAAYGGGGTSAVIWLGVFVSLWYKHSTLIQEIRKDFGNSYLMPVMSPSKYGRYYI